MPKLPDLTFLKNKFKKSSASNAVADETTVANATAASKADDDPEGRGGWGSHLEFILSCVGYSVGLGNVWRFPYLAYKNGGASFVIPYVISVIIAGLPLYFLELSLGQFSSYGPGGVFKNLAPAFEGIGWGMVVCSLLVSLYYNMIIAWVLFYFFHSFRSDLLWSRCDNYFNTDSCYSSVEQRDCRESYNKDPGAIFFNRTCYNSSMVQILGFNETVINKTSSVEEFFERYMLERGADFSAFDSVSWKLALCLAASWLLVFACLCKGVQSTGKVVYFTATFPYLVLFILLVRGVTLVGAKEGLLFYVTPDVEKLKDWQVWKDAAEQVFFSLGPAFGGLMTMASYNKFHTNCKRDAIIISFVDSFTSTFAGLAIFSATGFMAHQLNVPVDKVVKSGMGLAFLAYPEAISHMPVSPLWSILFFFMLINLGLDSEFAMLETVTTALIDSFPRLRTKKLWVIGGMCCALFLLGLPFCTPAGIYVFELLNTYSAGYCVIILALTECLVVSYVYGIRRFLKDVGMMLGEPPKYYWMATLAFLSPVYLLFVLIASFVALQPVEYGGYVFGPVAQGLGIALSFLSVLCIPGFAIYHLVKCIWKKQPLKTLITATNDWCPAADRAKRRPNIAPASDEVWTTSTKL